MQDNFYDQAILRLQPNIFNWTENNEDGVKGMTKL